MKQHYAKVSWHIDDILTLRENWTPKEAIAFLKKYEDSLRSNMIQTGWSILEDLLPEEE